MSNLDIAKLKDKYNNFEMKSKKAQPLKKVGNSKLSASRRKFLNKLEEELFSDFSSTDWIFYFQKKYEEQNSIGYSIVGERAWSMEHSIYKRLIKDYVPMDIKLLIDFIFDSNQDIVSKAQAGSYLFSGKWIQGVYQSAILWRVGQYKPKSEINNEKYQHNKRNREWISDKAEDNLDEPKIVLKRRKKGTITF